MINLTPEISISEIIQESDSFPLLIFKHSTRCGISQMALNRIQGNLNSLENAFGKVYYLDLIKYRDLSNIIASQFCVEHESPQVLVISKGKSVYNASYSAISPQSLLRELSFISNN